MDFSLDETQEELRGLAADVLAREASPERRARHDASGARYDAAAWRAMARAGLLAVAEDTDHDGGLGPVEVAVVLREVGARTAPVPALATLALGGLPVALCGTADQRAALGPVAAGERILSAGVSEPGRPPGTAAEPVATAERAGDHYVLTGVLSAVPHGADAHTVLVPARLADGGTGVLLVHRDTEGVRVTARPTGTGDPADRLGLDGVRVPVTVLLGDDRTGAAVRTLQRCALAGIAATVSGALAGALELTTEHVRTRRQFDRALAELQAVTMQVGDVYVASRALDAAMWAGAWRLAATPARPDPATPPERPDAFGGLDGILESAALLVTDQVLDACYTAQHLHGGLGVDITYPLQRHFSAVKWASQLLGGPEARLDALGGVAATDTPVHVLPA